MKADNASRKLFKAVVKKMRLFRSPFEALIDKATSENIIAGSEDIETTLDVCESIQSLQTSPKEAIALIHRRIETKQPNVQILAFKLLDSCAKNCGKAFLEELASKSFVHYLEKLIRSGELSAKSHAQLLECIQIWGLTFADNQYLRPMTHLYNNLKSDGVSFPMVPANLSKILFSTKNPPPWNDSPFCTLCKDSFTVTNRKHHCRKCGDTFCKNCSNKSMDLPEFGLTLPVRVCDSCYQHQYQRGGNFNPKKTIDKKKEIVEIINGSTCITATSTKEEEDLQLALKLSLQQFEPSINSAEKVQEISRKEEIMSVTIEKISDLEKDLIIQFANSMDTLSKEPPHQRYISDALYESYLNIYTYQGKLQIELEKISKKYQDVYSLKLRLLESLNNYETLIRAPFLPSTMSTNAFQAVYSNTTILNEPYKKTPQIQSSYYSVAEDILTPDTTLKPQNLETPQPNLTSKNSISQTSVPPFSQQHSYTNSPQGIEYSQPRNLPQESFKFQNVNDAILQSNQIPSSQSNSIYLINSTKKFQPTTVPTYYSNPVPTYQVNPMPSAPELQESKYDQPADDEPLIEF